MSPFIPLFVLSWVTRVLGGSPLCQRWSRHRRRHHVHRSKARRSDHHALPGDCVRAFRTHFLEVITLTHYTPRATTRGASTIDKFSFAYYTRRAILSLTEGPSLSTRRGARRLCRSQDLLKRVNKMLAKAARIPQK